MACRDGADMPLGMASRRKTRKRSSSVGGWALLAGLFVVGVVAQVLEAVGPVLGRVALIGFVIVFYAVIGALVVDGVRAGWDVLHSRPAAGLRATRLVWRLVRHPFAKARELVGRFAGRRAFHA